MVWSVAWASYAVGTPETLDKSRSLMSHQTRDRPFSYPKKCDRPFSNPSFVIPADLEPMKEHFLHLKAIDLVAFLEVRSPPTSSLILPKID
jgi:hypothetical protein